MLIVGGIAAVITGLLLDERGGYVAVFGTPIVIAGAGAALLPLLHKRPGALEASAPARLFAWVGPMSYAVLIANEPLRLVGSFLLVEGVSGVAWWMFLVAYVPITLAIARPLAGFLGLLPRSPRPNLTAALHNARPDPLPSVTA